MESSHLEILSALIDGEAVDPDALAEALRTPGAAEQLVAFARLRYEVQADFDRPDAAFYERMEKALRPKRARWARLSAVIVPAAAAAALWLAAVSGGLWPMAHPSAPPAPPAPALGPTSSAPPAVVPPTEPRGQPPGPLAAPAPRRPTVPPARRVMQYEPGRDWREISGS